MRGAGALRVPFARLPRPPARRDAASALDARVPAPVSLPEVVGDRSPAGGAAAEADRAAGAAAPALSGSSGAASVARSVARHAWTTAPRNARLQIVASVACLVAAKALTVSVPFLLQGCVDGLVARDRAAAVRATALYCGARVAVVLASEARSLTYAHASQQAVRGYARELFGSLHALGPAFHARHPTGLLSVAFSRGARGFQTLLFQLLFSVLPTLVELGLSAAVLGRRFGASVGLGTVATFLAYAAFTARVIDAKVRVKRRLVALDNAKSAYLVDSLGGTETVKLFNGEAVEALRFDDFLRSMVRAFVASSRVNGLLNVGQALIFSAGLGGCLLQATRHPGALTLGDVVAVNALLLQLAQPMNFLGYTASEIRQSLVDMRVTEDILAARRAEDARRGGAAARVDAAAAPGVAFDDVAVAYDGSRARALDGATFFAPPGKTTVLVGASGSGKSTALRVVAKLVAVDGGAARLTYARGDVDVADAAPADLRAALAVVPQDSRLFDESVWYNVRFGDMAAADGAVDAALAAARLGGAFGGADPRAVRVGEGACRISGGERQRVGVARALLRDPRLLVADEPTSAADPETERHVLRALAAADDRTVLIAAHRLAAITPKADHVVVFSRGRVVQQGTHAALLRDDGGEYARLWAAALAEDPPPKAP